MLIMKDVDLKRVFVFSFQMEQNVLDVLSVSGSGVIKDSVKDREVQHLYHITKVHHLEINLVQQEK